MHKTIWALIVALLAFLPWSVEARSSFSLNADWSSTMWPEGGHDSLTLERLTLPHNWDDYYGYRQYVHGNLHGRARYVKRFTLASLAKGVKADEMADRLFTLRLEGVGTYVSVWVNGTQICHHQPAGRVVTSLDLTGTLHTENLYLPNELVIECDHPSLQTDMPWVCGGCSSEWGFSEGSAPLGLFRNVMLEVTDKLRVEPFGVHAWASESLDTLYVDTEVSNNDRHAQVVVLQTIVEGKLKKVQFQMGSQLTQTIHQAIPTTGMNLRHWTAEDPKLYTLTTVLVRGTRHDVEADRVQTEVGFSNVRWPQRTADGKLVDTDHRFSLNGKPTFIHGVCEYEHLFGGSHALSNEEIDYRCELVKRMGFNALRDAHQPHHLRYGDNLARLGILWWPQFSAHIWYDTPQFRDNYKRLLRQWVRERRNNPAVMLWGLQNESTLPADFASECRDIIREMDPRHDRLVTTCNGGSGTDWNVVQNWSGTYGGDLAQYGAELANDDQLLNGEYGGWRTVGLHDLQDRGNAAANYDAKAAWSEEHFCVLLHEKLRLAWRNRERVCGQFQWLMASHDNPGRQQPDEFLRAIDKVGPLNYKGLLTATWDPTDAYYLYRAWGAFLTGQWPVQRKPADAMTARQMVKLGYELDDVPLPDYLLDEAATEACARPDLHTFARQTQALMPEDGRVYLYRYNCGGDAQTDSWGNLWMGDDTRYSYSWSMAPQFAADNLCPVLGSQSQVRGWVTEPSEANPQLLAANADQSLLRSYRYGRHALKFRFPVPEGYLYQIDLWTINSRHEVKRVSYKTQHTVRGILEVGFERVRQGQAKVSAIAISVEKAVAKKLGKMEKGTFVFKPVVLTNHSHPAFMQEQGYPYSAGLTWADLEKQTIAKTDKATLPADKGGRPAARFEVQEGSQFHIQMGLAQEYALRFRYKNTTGAAVAAHWQLLPMMDGGVVAEGDLSLPVTPDKMKMLSTTTGTYVNAGHYRLVVTGANGVVFESVEVQ